MKKRTDSEKILLEVISEKYSKLGRKDKVMLAKIVTKYVELLEESRIEEVADYLNENLDFLVKLL